jgi:TPR repeat protein
MKARFLVTFLGVFFFSSSYATLEQCYKNGLDENYENVLETCKTYFKKDARATGLLAEANIQLDRNDKLALDDAIWSVNFYKKNSPPTSIEGQKSYAYLVYLIGELYYFGSENGHIKVDAKKGFDYIKKAGNLGYAVAQNQLGNFYVRSTKIPRTNFAEAYKWYKLAVANGSLDARKAYILSNEKDFVEQYPYCISQGRTLIGDAYLVGNGGLLKDNAKAIEWYNKAYGVDHVSPVEVGLAKAYMASGDNKKALTYAKEAITQPYAPAFLVMVELTDDKVEKYIYLSIAISLFKYPELKFWGQFNENCLPDLSGNGIDNAKKQLSKISLDDSQKEQFEKMTKNIESHWKTEAAIN